MKNDFSGFAKHQKEKLDKYFKKDEKLTFKKIAVGEDDFYFIYKSKAVILKDKIASYELIPVGFIHNQDEEYYYYSFDGNCLGYEDIVKKFVEECLIYEGEYLQTLQQHLQYHNHPHPGDLQVFLPFLLLSICFSYFYKVRIF